MKSALLYNGITTETKGFPRIIATGIAHPQFIM
jgi:hypothetical protein